MDIELESTGLKVKGNCVIQDLLPFSAFTKNYAGTD
jgi:hypothetical protein